jgi:hypothetical protein
LMAYVVLAAMVWLALQLRPYLKAQAHWLLALAALQLATGLSNVILDWPLLAAVLHTGGAAALEVVLTWALAASRTSAAPNEISAPAPCRSRHRTQSIGRRAAWSKRRTARIATEGKRQQHSCNHSRCARWRRNLVRGGAGAAGRQGPGQYHHQCGSPPGVEHRRQQGPIQNHVRQARGQLQRSQRQQPMRLRFQIGTQ